MMKLLNSPGCQFSGDRGNVKQLTMIVEEQGIGFWTRVQIPSTPPSFSYKTALRLESCFYVFRWVSRKPATRILFQPVLKRSERSTPPHRSLYNLPVLNRSYPRGRFRGDRCWQTRCGTLPNGRIPCLQDRHYRLPEAL